MNTLSGFEFKKTNSGPWYKWLREDMTHYEFTYTLGLNVDTVKFNPKGRHEPGGLYLIKRIDYLSVFYEHGPILGIFDIPDDAQVYIDENYTLFKCDKIVLIETVSSEKDLIEYFKKSFNDKVSVKGNVSRSASWHNHHKILKWAEENDYTCSDYD